MTSAALALILGVTACAPRMRIPGPMRAAAEYVPAPPEIVEPDAQPVQRRAEHNSGNRQTEEIARAAARLVGRSRVSVKGESFRADCSGFVAATYAAAGQHIAGSSADLHARAKAAGVLHRRRTPEVGDLAFFDNTYDRNGNGRRDDPLSHVAVVEAVADDGTVVLVHYGSKGVARITMDLRQPDVHVDEDGILRNSYVRSGGRGKRLTGELFRDFGSLWKVAGES